MIKMIGLDLDNTFLTSEKTLSEENRLAVRAALEAGIEVLPATGRPFHAIPEELLTACGFRYCVASGGATVHDLQTGKILFADLMDNALATSVTDLLMSHGFLMGVFADGYGYINEHEFEQAVAYAPTPAAKQYMRTSRVPAPDIHAILREADGIEKLTAASPKTADDLQRKREAEAMRLLSAYEEQLAVMGNCEISIEIQSIYAQKGSALVKLGKLLGIAKEEIMAFGDSGNDLEMLQTVGCGVAMGNANEALKAVADIIAPDNDHDGVAAIIRRVLAGNKQRSYR